jgi:hypothetical protein
MPKDSSYNRPITALDMPCKGLESNTSTKAALIGVFAGVPTGFFMQTGFVKTLAARNAPLKRSVHWLLPVGVKYAVARGIVYTAATQKQVQNAQEGGSSFSEDLALNAVIVVGPLFFDTLSIKTVSPNFKMPRNICSFLKTTCPPEAMLGRLIWVPLFNLVFVKVQASIGDSNSGVEFLGLMAGSIAASYVAFPAFMFKTNLLFAKVPNAVSPSTGMAFLSRSRLLIKSALAKTLGFSERGLMHGLSEAARNPARLFSGAMPHMLGNIATNVCCVAAGRLAFAQLAAMGMLESINI